MIVYIARLTEFIVFIATTKVYITDYEGNLRVCRAMLDPGPQSNIVTKDLLKKLKLKSNKFIVPISRICRTQITAKESITESNQCTSFR